MLLIQGSRDLYVDIGNLETMASAGEAANLPVTTLVVEGSGHRTVLFDMPKPEKAVNAAILSFVEDVSSSKGK